MNRAARSIVVAVVAAVATAAGLHLHDRSQAREAARLRREIGQLRAAAILRERARVTEERVQSPPRPGGSVEPAAAPATPPPAAAVPTPVYRNEGRSTARAALQTFAWACDRGDAAIVAGMLLFDAEARTRAQTWFASLPPEQRGEWRTLDEMAASLLTLNGMSVPFPDADVLDRAELQEISPDRVRLMLNGAPRHGSEFQRTGDGWKFVITPRMVDRYLEQLAARP